MSAMEAKYILSLCDDGPEEVIDELLSICDDNVGHGIQNAKQTLISDTCIQYLKKSIQSNQLAVLQYISIIKSHNIYKTNIDAIDKLILDEIESILDVIVDCTNNNKKHNVGSLISIIPYLDMKPSNEDKIKNDLFPKFHKLILAGYNKETYLSLIAQGNNMLKSFTQYEMQFPIQIFCTLDPNKMTDLCFGFKKHWLLEIIHNGENILVQNGGTQIHSTSFLKKIWQLVLINIINKYTEDNDISSNLTVLENLFSILEYQDCEQGLLLYINEIYRQVNLIKFCINNCRKKMLFGWCEKVQNHSALSLISQVCDLPHLDRFKLKQILTLNNDMLSKLQNSQSFPKEHAQWDIQTYNAYCVLISIIDIILFNIDESIENDKISHKMDEVKVMISHLYPINFRIEILQNIFSFLFLRFEYFSNDENIANQNLASHSDSSYFILKNNILDQLESNRGFMCNPPLVKEILSLVKNSLSDISNEISSSSTAPNDIASEDIIKSFEKLVSNAVYRWQLITNMKVSTPLKPSIISCLYNAMEISTDDEENDSTTMMRKKVKFRKRRSRSVNEEFLKLKSSQMTSVSLTGHKKNINKPDFISLMLSSPSTLLVLCLEAGEFSKAHRIVEVYDMCDTEGAVEVSYTERFLSTATQIRNSILFSDANTSKKVDQIEVFTGISVVAAAVVSLVEGFLSTNRAPYNYQISELTRTYPQLQLYDHRNSTLITIIDMLVSTGLDKNITYGIINVVEKKFQDLNLSVDFDCRQYDFLIFIKTIIYIVYDLYRDDDSFARNFGICDILRCDQIPIRYKEYTQQKEFFNKLSAFSIDVDAHNNDSQDKNIDDYKFLLHFAGISGKDIFNVCDIEAIDKSLDLFYIKKMYAYLKTMSKLLNSNATNMEDSMDSEPNLEILKLHIHDIIGQLIFEQKVSMDSIEIICKQLGINLIHKVVLNCCPTIPYSFKKNTMQEEQSRLLFDIVANCDIDNSSDALLLNVEDIGKIIHPPNKEVITYIVVHNWVIANLVKKIHSDSPEYALQQSMDARTIYLDLFLQQYKFDTLKVLYYNNKPLAALQTFYNENLIFNYLKTQLSKGNLMDALTLINALPEHQVFSNSYLNQLRDEILFKQSLHDDREDNWKCFLYITNRELQIENVLQYLMNWPYEGALKILEYIIYSEETNESIKDECFQWYTNIPVYEKISQYASENTWATIYSMSMEDPESVLQILLDAQQFNLCLTWANIHQISNNIRYLVIQNLLKQQLESPNENSNEELISLISALPSQQAVTLCNEMLYRIRDLGMLKAVFEFLVANSYDVNQYENLRIGIELLSEMEVCERVFFWDIINKPLLIIEQYLMNAKLDRLEKLLKKIRPMLKLNLVGDNLYYNIALINTASISINTVDALLRIYAAKSLDLKSTKSLKMCQFASKPEEAFLQSIDSINLVGEPSNFIMPEEVPSMDQWVPDNYTDRCMSCKTTIFSILIRRHHCRRCGRLVCYSCSRNKLQINDLYNNIKVRVCIDCYNQTMTRADSSFRYDKSITQVGSGSAYSDHTSMEWCLTADPKHNDGVRREFVYEFSPNVTLCLTIMKLHTINYDYPRFLLDRSKELSMEAGNGGGRASARELLKMRRALLLWCTVMYSRTLSAPSDNSSHVSLVDSALAHTERQLATTDAQTLLVTHGCHDILPKEDTFNSQCIRRLLEAEKWELALEISTKFGMSRSGVLAAWGKACLKAGCYQQARQKFALCFKTVPSNTSFSLLEDAENIKEPATNKTIRRLRKMELSTSSSQLDLSRVRGNPALLEEIISLLENISYPLNDQIVKKAESLKSNYEKLPSVHKSAKKIVLPEPALNIMHTLASVSKIKQGDFSDFSTCSRYAPKSKATNLLKKQNSQGEKTPLKPRLDPFFYKECLYYLTMYGSHGAIIEFYFKYRNTQEALQYCLDNAVEKETFSENIFMPCLKNNTLNDLLKSMNELDSTWSVWTDYLLHICRVLEHRQCLDALYLVQAGVGDHVRAAMTCAAQYTRQTKPPHASALQARAHYLAQARGHLQHVPRKITGKDLVVESSSSRTLSLKMDGVSLDRHINTITCQLEIAKFLYSCEKSGRLKEDIVNKIIPSVAPDDSQNNESFLPTLFGSQSQKVKLAVMIIICASNVEEGFSISSRIIHDYTLDPLKVFHLVARYLVNTDRYEDILQLCDCIKKSNGNNTSAISDSVVEISVTAVVRKCDSKGQLFDELAELLIEKAVDVATKITCYIECRILRTAYSLAVKNNRVSDLKRIMREAERLGQREVKNACVKRLQRL